MNERTITITEEQLRVLLEGLHIWNTPCLDTLTKNGRIKLRAAQELVEKMWGELRGKD